MSQGNTTSFFDQLIEMAGENRNRPFRNAVVSFRDTSYSALDRFRMMEKIGLNVFFFPSTMLSGCDLLSDSGTTTMSTRQWAEMMLGDEAYGSNEGYFQLLDTIKEVFGSGWGEDGWSFIFHQGRAAENAMFSNLRRILASRGRIPAFGPIPEEKRMIIPNNGHFDTTEANVEANAFVAMNLFSKELDDGDSDSHFKGDVDVAALADLLEKKADRVPLVYVTITNNTGGGQPVSLKNLKEISAICRKYELPLFFDACRFAENAWFIKRYEEGMQGKSIHEIVLECFHLADGFTVSFKKDGMTNMGGGLMIKKGGAFDEEYGHEFRDMLVDHQILVEGHPTYGGLTGRDLKALAEGLHLVLSEDYLSYRIGQVQGFGDDLLKRNVPILTPTGGHAVYLKIDEFFKDTAHKPGDFPGIALTALLLVFGHRLCELGHFAFGHTDKDGNEILPKNNFVRAAVPRLVYSRADLTACAEAIAALYDRRDEIPGVEVTHGRELTLRHFKSRFRFKNIEQA